MSRRVLHIIVSVALLFFMTGTVYADPRTIDIENMSVSELDELIKDRRTRRGVGARNKKRAD